VPGLATKARRMRTPSSERIGMFCRLGSVEDNRPVEVMAMEKSVCTRPSRGSSWAASPST